MKSNKAVVQALAMMLAANIARGTVSILSITQVTADTESVFVTAELPELGSLGVTKSVRMERGAYPIWRLPVDLPPGSTITPRYYIRRHDPTQLSVSSNATLIATGDPIATPFNDGSAPQRFNLYTTETSLTFAYADAVLLKGPARGARDETGWLRGEVPALEVAARRLVLARAGSTIFPADRFVRLNGRESWWRHGQGFLELPGETAPTPPRGETFTIALTGFASRTVRVHLPRGYGTDTARRYPVIYAMDGQNIRSYDAGIPRFGSWDMDMVVNDLVSHAEIPETIVIGVDNSPERVSEYIPSWGGGRGDEFLGRLQSELVPEVNARYRTKPGPQDAVIVGSSLGGLLAFQAALDFESTWGTAIAMSPSSWVDPAHMMSLAEQEPASRGRLWMDSGTAGTSSDSYTDTVGVRDSFLQNDEVLGPHFFHAVGIGDQHNEAAWKRRSYPAFRWAFAPSALQDKWTIH